MRKLLLASLLSIPCTALAAPGVLGDVSEVPDKHGEQKSGWNVSLGLGAVYFPEFPGVDDDETNAVPLINVNYENTYYLEFYKLGAWLWSPRNTGIRMGVVAKPRRGYDRGDGPIEYHDVDDTILAGARAKWNTGQFALDGYLLASTESDSGPEVHLTGTYYFLQSKQATISGFAGAEFLSEDAIDYLYYEEGAYDGADSTINLNVGVVGTYNIAPQWNVIGSVSLKSYGSEIEDAPGVTEDNGTTALLGVLYTF